MPQLKYEYYIDLYYNCMDYKEPKLIDQKNIKSLTIYKEYDKYNMPIATMNLHIDKKFADNIIKNSKTATMIMAVYKYQLDNNAAIKQLYFKHEFSYLTDDDTNKTEDIDYAKTDSKDEDREDVYRILKLGLISKKLVDRNLSPNNATIYKSSMQNIIVDLLNIGEPLLIEPFTETELVEQLIIPPKESLSKTLDYLNTIRVFYNTGYRFFMDLDNIYLVSKSGKATLRNVDKYATIKFNLSDIGGKEEAILEGFRDDDKTKSYIVDVPTTDIKYGKDNITDKELNGFTAVIDASKTVQQSYLKNSRAFGGIFGVYQNIMNTMNAIKKVSSSVRQVVKNIHQTTDTIKGNFNQIVEQAKESKSVIDTVATQAEALLRELPKTALDGTAEVVGLDGVVRKSDTNIKDVLTNIIKHTVVMQTTSTNTVEKSEDKFGKFKEAYTGQIYHIENFGSLVGAISPINFTDNTAQLTKEVSKLPEKREQSKIHFKESMTDFNTEYSKYITSNEIIVNSLNDTPDKLFYVTKKDNTGKAIETHELDLRALKSNLPELVKNLDFSKMKLSDMKGFAEQMKNSLKLNANVGDGLKKQIAATREIPKDFSKQILEGANTYVKSLQDTKNIAIVNTKNSIINTTKSLGALKSNLSSLYQSGSTAISGISDMSKVGTNGESMIDVALDLTDIVEDLGKRKLIRIPNDNMGLIKNFKHALELKSVYLSLSKQQLDNSIFNMNLKYLINNNTKEHKEDTTDYIMLSKIEVYTNQGERFLATTNMTFAKLPKNTAENAKKI
nr:MAG TPA: hypothetical protein [Caudoviricetes sp.]